MKGMLSIPEREFFVMAEKPKLNIPFRVSEGWFDDESYLAIVRACWNLYTEAYRYVEFEVLDVSFRAQTGWIPPRYEGFVWVGVEIKGVTLNRFYAGSKKLAEFKGSSVRVVGNKEEAKKEPPHRALTMEDPLKVWSKEFKEHIARELRLSVHVLKSDLKVATEHFDFITKGKPPVFDLD